MRKLLAAALMCCFTSAYSAEPSGLDLHTRVAVVIGKVVIPLGVEVRFADVAKRLPAPGRIAAKEERGTYCYCYRYSAGGNESIVLELYDSDLFGMHAAHIVRASSDAVKQCAVLKSKPLIQVGTTLWDIDSPTAPDMSKLPASKESTDGFLPEDGKKKGYAGRTWEWQDVAARRWHAVSIVYRPNQPGAGFAELQISNWAEPSQ